MLTHEGCAVAKVFDDKEMEVIEYSENPDDISRLRKKAADSNCYIVYGAKRGNNNEYYQL